MVKLRQQDVDVGAQKANPGTWTVHPADPSTHCCCKLVRDPGPVSPQEAYAALADPQQSATQVGKFRRQLWVGNVDQCEVPRHDTEIERHAWYPALRGVRQCASNLQNGRRSVHGSCCETESGTRQHDCQHATDKATWQQVRCLVLLL